MSMNDINIEPKRLDPGADSDQVHIVIPLRYRTFFVFFPFIFVDIICETMPLSNQLNTLKTKADQLSTEGNTLQSLECYTEILESQPRDEEALEGKISACIKLKLFHRCLADLAVLAERTPHDSKVYNYIGKIKKTTLKKSCYSSRFLYQ